MFAPTLNILLWRVRKTLSNLLKNGGKCIEKYNFFVKYFDKIQCYADRPYLVFSELKPEMHGVYEDLITPKDEHSLEEKFSVSKQFYTFIKHKKTDSTGIKRLKKNGVTIPDPENKADLDQSFPLCFLTANTNEILCSLCIFSSILQNNENDMPEIHVTENGVLKLLKALNISNAAGPDGGNMPMLAQFIRREIRQTHPTIVLCIWPVFHVSS